MQHRKYRRVILLGAMAIACALFGITGTAFAQQKATYVPIDAPKPDPKNVGKFAPLDWTPAKGEHPGKKHFVNVCQACHKLNETKFVGPGLAGLADRVPERARLLRFITDPKSVDDDDYFKKRRAEFSDGMAAQGTAGVKEKGTLSEQDILDVIDFILRHKAEYGPPPEQRIIEGRKLASGAKGFANGAPSCIGCHTIGADKNLRGATVGPNIAHTWVIAKDKAGLQALMEKPDGPAMHHFYRANDRPIEGDEYDALITFFERAARDTGTEVQANFLPIFALIVAAVGIFIFDGSIFGKMFVHEDHEFVDGPYAEEDHGHGHDDHGHTHDDGAKH